MTFDKNHSHLTHLDFDQAGHINFERLAYKAHGNPSINNDANDTAGIGIKFQVGFKWVNLDTQIEFLCMDTTPTHAVWREEVNTNGYQHVNISPPIEKSHATNKKYVDNLAILMPIIFS